MTTRMESSPSSVVGVGGADCCSCGDINSDDTELTDCELGIPSYSVSMSPVTAVASGTIRS